MKTNQANSASITAVIGATGSGKGVYVKAYRLEVDKPKRLIIFDPLHEYGEYATPVNTLAELARAASKNTFKVSFFANTSATNLREQFETFCQIAHSVPNNYIVAEELSLVTTASYAPPKWRGLLTMGRHTGQTIIGMSQSPALMDKTIFGQANLIRCGRLNFADHIKVMANVLNVPPTDVSNLKTFEYIQRTMNDGHTSTGIVKVPQRWLNR